MASRDTHCLYRANRSNKIQACRRVLSSQVREHGTPCWRSVVKLLQCRLWVYWSPASDPMASEEEMICAFKKQAGKEPFANKETSRNQIRIRCSNLPITEAQAARDSAVPKPPAIRGDVDGGCVQTSFSKLARFVQTSRMCWLAAISETKAPAG